MSRPIPQLTDEELPRAAAEDEPGFGSLATSRGHLPLKAMNIQGRIDGLMSQVSVRQTFVNPFDEPLEATYIFPLPDRAAVRGFRMVIGGRTIEGLLQEREQARQDYDKAIAAGRHAAIAEEERPNVFTLRVGNLMPHEEATVHLELAGVLPYSNGEVTFRFPLVIAPRYIPGIPLSGSSVGEGTAVDTDAVPDASRISPPVLLPGFPNPVRLSVTIDLYDHNECISASGIRSSLHAILTEQSEGFLRIQLQPGDRLNRDFILRFRLGSRDAEKPIDSSLSLHPDPDGRAGTFALTLIPPSDAKSVVRPRDIAFVLDRSGSMGGWKIVAARRAMARMIDTLGDQDRFTVLAFDDRVEAPPGLDSSLAVATDRNRFRALEYLARIDARGGTEMAAPLRQAADRLNAQESARDAILVLVTDGQVGNEDQILQDLGPSLTRIRVFTLGIDQAVNEAFLRRLAELGRGACELVESEHRLDEVMTAIHRQISTPLLTGLTLEPEGFTIEADSLVPERLPDLFPSAPLLVLGRFRGHPLGQLAVRARDAAGRPWSETLDARVRDNPAITSTWARGQVRKLEDRYVIGSGDSSELESQIVAVSIRHQVLSRFTAYVAIDHESTANTTGELHRITQPVEAPQGWVDAACLAAPSLGVANYMADMDFGLAPPMARRLSRARGAPASPSSPSAKSRGYGGVRSPAKDAPVPPVPPCGMPAADALSPGSAGESAQWPEDGLYLLESLECSSAAPVDHSKSLQDLLSERRPGFDETARWVAEIAEALQDLLARGLVHPDVTPARVLITPEGRAIFTDPASRCIKVGKPGQQVWAGSPAFSAPERIGQAKAPYDVLSSIYSLGVMFYEMLTGVAPFSGSTAEEILKRVSQGTFTPPRRVKRSIPKDLESICLKAMARKPEDRYATPGELAQALRAFLTGQPDRKKGFWKRK